MSWCDVKDLLLPSAMRVGKDRRHLLLVLSYSMTYDHAVVDVEESFVESRRDDSACHVRRTDLQISGLDAIGRERCAVLV